MCVYFPRRFQLLCAFLVRNSRMNTLLVRDMQSKSASSCGGARALLQLELKMVLTKAHSERVCMNVHFPGVFHVRCGSQGGLDTVARRTEKKRRQSKQPKSTNVIVFFFLANLHVLNIFYFR